MDQNRTSSIPAVDPSGPTKLLEAEAALDARLAQIGGCSDGYCKVVKVRGMHTNGGCRCLRDPMTAERVVQAYRVFTDAALAAHTDRPETD